MHPQAGARGRLGWAAHQRVVALCWLVTLLDGYDLIMYGTIVPSLLRDPTWHMSPGQVGVIGGVTLAGGLLGGLVAGSLTNRLGRRRLIVGCLILFSLTTGLAALAPTPETFGLLRFVAGLGLGGLTPTASALTLEYAPAARRNFLYGLMLSGLPLGGLLASLLAVVLIPMFGFRAMPLLGFAGLLAVPLVVRYLPESVIFLESRRTPGSSPRPVAGLFRRDVRAATFLFWSATILSLVLISGLFTWLPEIMRGAGYSLGSALVFFLSLNLGGVLGMLAAARAADRFGLKKASTLGCLLAAVSIALLSFRLPAGVNYPLSVAAGTGALGAQLLINSCAGQHYLPAIRATALAWTAGISKIGAIIGPPLGALIVSSELDVAWNFYVYALVAVAAAALIVSVPRRPTKLATVSDPQAPTPEEG